MIAVLAVDRKQYLCFLDSYVEHLASWESRVGFDAMFIHCLFTHVENVKSLAPVGTYTQLIKLDGWHKIKNAYALESMVRRRIVKPE